MAEAHVYRQGNKKWYLLSVCIIVILLILGLQYISHANKNDNSSPITIYCAAGVRKPVEILAARYEEAFGRTVRLNYGSSGELEGKLAIDAEQGINRADIYIPADLSFAKRAQEKGLIAERIALAQFRLVAAGKPDGDLKITSLQDILDQNLAWSLCEKQAGAGKKTYEYLSQTGKYETFMKGAKTSFPRVTEAASAVATSETVDLAFIWNSTAKQFNLRVYDIAELKDAQSTISANIVSSSTNPTGALHLSRWLAASKHQEIFKEHHFTPVASSDTWADIPEVEFYSGSLNREAIDRTVRSFEAREGCRIKIQYAGCGALVAGIKSRDHTPDSFFTCDASYLKKVEERFGADVPISQTQIVMLVRPGNPKNIKSIADLGRPGLRIGTNDPVKSTLGFLSWELFRAYKIDQKIKDQETIAVYTPSAPELVAQMDASGSLDAALVYKANIQHLSRKLETIEIDHPLARARQHIAVSKKTKYPQLMGRLIEALKTEESRSRFEKLGFDWSAQ